MTTTARAAWEQALQYAPAGYPVFSVHRPVAGQGGMGYSCGWAGCGAVGKHPRPVGWEKAATTEGGQMMAWQEEWPESNYAIATAPAGLVIPLSKPGVG